MTYLEMEGQRRRVTSSLSKVNLGRGLEEQGKELEEQGEEEQGEEVLEE